jgi:hypothetical protein
LQMTDVLGVLGVVVAFWLFVLYTKACDKL